MWPDRSSSKPIIIIPMMKSRSPKNSSVLFWNMSEFTKGQCVTLVNIFQCLWKMPWSNYGFIQGRRVNTKMSFVIWFSDTIRTNSVIMPLSNIWTTPYIIVLVKHMLPYKVVKYKVRLLSSLLWFSPLKHPVPLNRSVWSLMIFFLNF